MWLQRFSLTHYYLLTFWILKEVEYFLLFSLTFQYSLAWATYESMKLCPSVSLLLNAFVVKSNSWILISEPSVSGNLMFWISLDWMFCMIKIGLWGIFNSSSKTSNPLPVQLSCPFKCEVAACDTWTFPKCSSYIPVHVQLCPDLSSLYLTAA